MYYTQTYTCICQVIVFVSLLAALVTSLRVIFYLQKYLDL